MVRIGRPCDLQVSRGLAHADDVRVRRGRPRAELLRAERLARSTHSGASVLPLLASISIPRSLLERYVVECGEGIIGEDQQRQRFVTNQSARQLGGKGLPQPLGPAEGDVQASREQLGKCCTHSTAVAHRELGLGCCQARRVDDPGGGEPLADDVDEQRSGRDPRSSLQRRVVEREQRSGMHQQALTVGGQGDVAGAAREEASADLRFQSTGCRGSAPAARRRGERRLG